MVAQDTPDFPAFSQIYRQQRSILTVLRRSEPSSRTLLTGEQPDPWDLLQPQDRMSRHRTFSTISCCVDYTFIPIK